MVTYYLPIGGENISIMKATLSCLHLLGLKFNGINLVTPFFLGVLNWKFIDK